MKPTRNQRRTFSPLSRMLPAVWHETASFEERCLSAVVMVDDAMALGMTREDVARLMEAIAQPARLILDTARQPNPLRGAPQLVLRPTPDGSKIEVTGLGALGLGLSL